MNMDGTIISALVTLAGGGLVTIGTAAKMLWAKIETQGKALEKRADDRIAEVKLTAEKQLESTNLQLRECKEEHKQGRIELNDMNNRLFAQSTTMSDLKVELALIKQRQELQSGRQDTMQSQIDHKEDK